MLDLDMLLDQLAASLQARCPTRLVGRELRDIDDRLEADLARGVYTLVSRGQPEPAYLSLTLIGQIVLPESAARIDVERAELQMLQELQAFARQPGTVGLPCRISSWQQSAQLDHPYGWVAAELRVGPLITP
ncbi:MAG: hypothetical protein ACOY5C_02795 [Pseudomonadota bacterium]